MEPLYSTLILQLLSTVEASSRVGPIRQITEVVPLLSGGFRVVYIQKSLFKSIEDGPRVVYVKVERRPDCIGPILTLTRDTPSGESQSREYLVTADYSGKIYCNAL